MDTFQHTMTQATKKKHVTREVIDNFEFPDEDQEIVQIIRGCGNNLHEVITPEGEKYLVSMPTKFRRSIWIKRGDYCVVTPIKEGNKVRAEISSILLKDQIRHYKLNDRWPKQFDDNNKLPDTTDQDQKLNCNKDNDSDNDESDDFEDDLVPNNNRLYYDESSEDSEENSDEDRWDTNQT